MNNCEQNFEREIEQIVEKLKNLDENFEIVWLQEDVYEIIDNIEHHIYIGEKIWKKQKMEMK